MFSTMTRISIASLRLTNPRFKITIVLDQITEEVLHKSSNIVSTSLTWGMFVIVTFFFVKIVEASMGSVAFLEPEIVIDPEIFLPPLISNFCI